MPDRIRSIPVDDAFRMRVDALEDAQALPEEHRPTLVMDRIDRLVPSEIWAELGWSETDS